MAVIIPVVSKFDDKGLKQAQSEFGKLGKSMKGLLGAAGIGISLGAITSGLKASASAAAEDVKSQALLANQLKNTMGATDSQIASVEASIKAMQNQAAVADDVIRPAFASLVRATGDVGQATQLTSLALDVAAGTGKDLGAVSLALGKAVNGSTTSLLKLVPSIKGASDPMGVLAKQFDGAAEAAANNDPMQQLNILFGEMQEQIGMYLLPALQDMAAYFASPEGQANLDDFATSIGNISTSIINLGKVLQNSGIGPVLDSIFGGINFTLGTLAGDQKTIDQMIYAAAGVAAPVSKSKAMAAAANRERAMGNLSTKGVSSFDGSGSKSSGASTAQKKADAAAKAAAAKAAKARQAIIDAAKKASDEAKQAFEDLKVAVDEFNKSFAQTADGFNAVFKFSAPLGEFEQQTVDAFQSMKDAADQAFSGGLIDDKALANLKAYADRESALLVGIAKQRDQLAKKISIAQSVTSGVMGSLDINSMLQSETKTVAKSVTSIVNGIALTTTQSFDEVVTGGLAASFKKLVDKTKTFAGNLTKLKQLGLNGSLFKQIVEGGADAGGATAEAIIAGGADAVKELNGLFGELEKAGSDIAATSTPVLYALGEDITNSFIDGLRSEDQKLIDTATAMAALFTTQFKTSIGAAMDATLNVAGNKAGIGKDLIYVPGIGRVTSDYMGSGSGSSVTNNITVQAGVIASKQELPSIIVDALNTAAKQGLSTRIINAI